MTDSSRQCVIVGNWKMYKTIEEASSFVEKILPTVEKAACIVVLAVPFTAIKSLADKVKSTKLFIAAQNINDATEGAFTGEVAASMIQDAGATYVILGHSERRRYFNETDEFINRKVKKALEYKIKPILCIGETYEKHEQNETKTVIEKQLRECLAGISSQDATGILISYEPIWAIGTGKPAQPDVVEETHKFCRDILASLFDENTAKKIPILYGGSVSPENADSFLVENDVDGMLVGGASLKPESFEKIIELRVKSSVLNSDSEG